MPSPRHACIAGIYEHPLRLAPDHSVGRLHADVAHGALQDAGLSLDDVDGYFCAGDAPGMGANNMADYLGLTKLRHIDTTDTGGSAYLIHVSHAAQAIAAARAYRPVYVHFELRTDRRHLTAEALDAAARWRDETSTPYINAHIIPARGSFLDMPVDTADPGAIGRVSTALQANGIHVVGTRHAEAVAAAYGETAAAWSLKLALAVGVLAILVAGVGIVVLASTARRARSRDYAALALVGQRPRSLALLAQLETVPVIVASALLGAAVGWWAAPVAVSMMPLFPAASATFQVLRVPVSRTGVSSSPSSRTWVIPASLP